MEVSFEGSGGGLGLVDEGCARREGGSEEVADERVMSAAENGTAGNVDFLAEFGDVLGDEGAKGCAGSATFNGSGKVRAGLLDDGDAGTALSNLDGIAGRLDGPAGGEYGERAGAIDLWRRGWYGGGGLGIPGETRGGFDGGRDDSDDIAEDAVLAATRGQPLLLDPTKGNHGSSVAGEDGEGATFAEEPLEAGTGEVENVDGRLHAVGCVAVIAEINEILMRQCVHECAMHCEPAKSAIENTDHLNALPPGSVAATQSPRRARK